MSWTFATIFVYCGFFLLSFDKGRLSRSGSYTILHPLTVSPIWRVCDCGVGGVWRDITEVLWSSRLAFCEISSTNSSAVFVRKGLVALHKGEDSAFVSGVRESKINPLDVAAPVWWREGLAPETPVFIELVDAVPNASEAGWLDSLWAPIVWLWILLLSFGGCSGVSGPAGNEIGPVLCWLSSNGFARCRSWLALKRFCWRTDGAVGKKSAKPADERDIVRKWLQARGGGVTTSKHHPWWLLLTAET